MYPLSFFGGIPSFSLQTCVAPVRVRSGPWSVFFNLFIPATQCCLLSNSKRRESLRASAKKLITPFKSPPVHFVSSPWYQFFNDMHAFLCVCEFFRADCVYWHSLKPVMHHTWMTGLVKYENNAGYIPLSSDSTPTHWQKHHNTSQEAETQV